MMLSTHALLILGSIAVLTAAAPSQKTCCNPRDWEAMAVASAAYGYREGSKAFSGRVAVDHSRQMASLILLKDLMEMKDMNMTANHTSVIVTVNNSAIYFYFLYGKEQQRQMADQRAKVCSAWVFHNAISGLGNRCFPDNSASIIDQLKTNLDGPSLPASLIAYSYGGLASLLAFQAFVSAHDCSPQMFSMSTPSDGLKLSLTLSSFSQGLSHGSLLSGTPAMCSNVVADNIDMSGLGLGLLEAMKGSQSKDNSWVDDLVTMYVISQVRGGHRHRRDTSGLNETKLIEGAMALKSFLQAVRDFIGDLGDGESSNDIETSILLNKLLSGQNKQPSDIAKGMLLDRLLSGSSRDSSSMGDLDKGLLLDKLLGRNDESSSDDVETAALLAKILSERDDGRRDDHSDDIKKVLLLDQLMGSRDDSTRDDIKKAILLDELMSQRDDGRRESHDDDVKKAYLLDQLMNSRDDSTRDDVKKAYLLDQLMNSRDDSTRDDVKKAYLLDQLMNSRDDSTRDDVKKAYLLDQLMNSRDDSTRDDVKTAILLDELMSQRDDSRHKINKRDTRGHNDDDVKKAVLLDELMSQRDSSRRDSHDDDVKKAFILDQLMELMGSREDSTKDDVKKAFILDQLMELMGSRDDSTKDNVKKAVLLDELMSQRDDSRRDSHDDDVKKAYLLDQLMNSRDDSTRDDVKKAYLLDQLMNSRDDGTRDDVMKAILLNDRMSQRDEGHLDDVEKGKLLEQLLSGDKHDGVLGMLFSRRSRRDLTDVLNDGRGRSSFDQKDVDAMIQFFIERQLICILTCDGKRRRSADYSDLESLAELLVARKLLSGTKRNQQEQYIEAAQTLLEMQSIRDLHSLVHDMTRYGLLDQQSIQRPDLRRLVKLGALGAAISNQKSSRIDAKTLYTLMNL